LSPILQCPHGYPKHRREIGLRLPQLDPGFGGLADLHNKPTSTAGLDLADGLQHFFADVALGIACEGFFAQLFHDLTL
jgi:hypothetical protein